MSVRSELSKLWRILTNPDYRAFRRNYKAFRAAHGRLTPTAFSGLSKGDVVLDIGGYVGEWAASMTSQYPVTVHVFEPHPRFAAGIEKRFSDRNDIIAHSFAIGSCDGHLELSDDENASSALVSEGPSLTGRLRAVSPVFDELSLTKVALAKINIEGGEYDLLPAMIDGALIQRVERIMIQFHEYSDADHKRRDDIRAALSQTHECVWSYPFIWEYWELRSAGAD